MVVLVGGFELAHVGKLRDEPDLLPVQLSHGVGDGPGLVGDASDARPRYVPRRDKTP